MQSTITRASLSTLLIGAVTIAPVTSASASPLGYKLQRIMTLQPEGDGEPAPDPAAAGEGEAAAPAPEGPAPAPAAPAGPPPPKGLGMMISGIVVTAAYGLPVTFWGTFALVNISRAEQVVGANPATGLGKGVAATIMVFGIIGLAIGVPLLAVGASRFSKYQKWKAGQTARLAPTASMTPFGTVTPGLALRF